MACCCGFEEEESGRLRVGCSCMTDASIERSNEDTGGNVRGANIRTVVDMDLARVGA